MKPATTPAPESPPTTGEQIPTSEAPSRQAPVRRAFFLGWIMVVVAGVGQYMSAPGQSYSVAAFKDPMRSSLLVSETNYSFAYATATIVSACLLPFVGRLIDRYGARRMLPLIGLGLCAACYGMSHVKNLGQLYLAFTAVRSIGQGALSLVSIWLIGEWFTRRRGMATAIAGIGGGLSVMTVPLINNWLIEQYGWQTAWVILATVVGGTLVIPGWIIIRDRPEPLGLFPDGIAPSSGGDESKHSAFLSPTEETWTVREVLANRTFWKLLAVPVTSGLVGTGLVFHQVSIMASHGFSATRALGLLSLQAAVAMTMTFPAGWATDRIESRKLLSSAMICLTVAVVMVIHMPFRWQAFVYALALGIHGSVLRSTAQVVWINYYGRANQGAVRGAAWSAMILASAAGPVPLAISIDRYGSYQPALLTFAVLPLIAMLAVATARQPRKEAP